MRRPRGDPLGLVSALLLTVLLGRMSTLYSANPIQHNHRADACHSSGVQATLNKVKAVAAARFAQLLCAWPGGAGSKPPLCLKKGLMECCTQQCTHLSSCSMERSRASSGISSGSGKAEPPVQHEATKKYRTDVHIPFTATLGNLVGYKQPL